MQRSAAGAPEAIEPRAPVLVALLAVLAGCTPPASTSRPIDPAATPTPVPAVTTSPGSQLTDTPIATLRPDQVDTEWGPIWEAVPVDFPVLAGAQPAEADTVVSAAYAVPTSSFTNPRAVANEYGRLFASAGLGGGVDGPLEDGSYTAWASNGYGCDLLVTAVPRGSEEIYVTVMYGALCPIEWQR